MPTKREKEMRFVKNDGKDARRNGRRAGRMTVVMAVVALLCLAAVLFVACNKYDELPATSPVSWEHYLSDAAERIADNIVLTGGRIGMKLTAHAVTDSGGYDFLFGMNYDTADSAGSCIVIEVKRASGARGDAEAAAEDALFSLVADDSSTWIDIAPGLAVSDARLKVENVNIFDLLGVVYNEENEDAAREAFAGIVFNLGKAFFSGARPDGDADIYTFVVDSGYKETGREYFDAVLGVFGDEVASALLAAFGLGSPDELFDLLPDMSGEVTLTFDGEGGAAFSADGLTVGDGGAEFDAVFDVQSEFYAELAAKVPDGDAAGYVVTKVGNSHMEGQLSLMQGGGALVMYDYVLDANLDLLTLISADYDLGALGDDNYFHLRVSHTCSIACGTFCSERLSPARGAIVDLAFSPSDFDGSYNVYASVAISSLISSARAAEITAAVGLTSWSAIPEYTLFTYPEELFGRDSFLCRLLVALYAGNMFADDDVTVEWTDLNDMSGGLAAMLGEDASGIDALLFDVETNMFGMAQPHDIYKETVYIIDTSVGDIKDYTSFSLASSMRQIIALYWEWEPYGEFAEDGETQTVTNIYNSDGEILHGGSDGAYVPMSPEEISGMLGDYYVKAQCTYIDKTVKYDFYARVLGIEGLDTDSSEVQDVVLVAEYPNPLQTDGFSELFADARAELTMRIPARIKLTERTSANVSFTPRVAADEALRIITGSISSLTGHYSGQTTTVPDYLYANARVEYVNGYVKEMELVGECDGVGVRNMLIFPNYYYSSACGDVTVRWSFLDGNYALTYRIQPPDRVEFSIDAERIPVMDVGNTVYMSSITNHIDAVAYYNDGDEALGVDLYLNAENLFINGISFAENSSYWVSEKVYIGGYTVTFSVASDYLCNAEVFGFESESFVLRVASDSGDYATYMFTQDSSDNVFWFTGTEYLFSGYIGNATHGYNAAPERTLEVSVGRYDSAHAQYPGEVDLTAADSPVTLSSFTASPHFAASADRANVLETSDFPDLLTARGNVAIRLTFNEPGYYRISLRLSGMGGFTNYWYITVAE